MVKRHQIMFNNQRFSIKLSQKTLLESFEHLVDKQTKNLMTSQCCINICDNINFILSFIPLQYFHKNTVHLLICYVFISNAATYLISHHMLKACSHGSVIGPQWCSGNTFTSHLWGRRFKPHTLCGESLSLLIDGRQLTVQNLDQLYVVVSSAHKTTHCDMTCTVLKAMLKLE